MVRFRWDSAESGRSENHPDAAGSDLGGDQRMVAFNAAKGALVNLTRGLAFDLGKHGIRVNAVAPALTITDETASSEPFAGWAAQISERQALQGHARPEDIAGAVTFLASQDARFVTGVILPVDGGTMAGSNQPNFF